MKTQELIGKTITSATMMKLDGYDDEGWLKLKFTDGTSCIIVGGYNECYTGNSIDEFPREIWIIDSYDDLVPIEQ